MTVKSSSNGLHKFEEKVAASGVGPLRSTGIDVLQVNLGFNCNMACKHCHVEAGPARTEMMDESTVADVLSALAGSEIPTLDLTGGSPELNPNYRDMVLKAREMNRRVMSRTNLTIFFEPGMDDLPEFYAQNGVELVASLPYYMESGVDKVRGDGAFAKSIEAMKRLNTLGYGTEGGASLNLVYNPPGAFLPPSQKTLEDDYKRELMEKFGVRFTGLFTFTNMPIGRFKHFLERTGNLDSYMDKLKRAFNPATLDGLMCRHLMSVGLDGKLYDCDFNLVLGLAVDESCPGHITEFDYDKLLNRRISVDDHCFGCTAGQGST